MSKQMVSTIKCPGCSFAREEKMPEDYCQIIYICTYCHRVIKPKRGDCCVYCSYGTNPCPPKQEEIYS